MSNTPIPPTPPQQQAATTPQPQAAVPQEPVVIPDTQIEELPQKLAELKRAVQIEATLIRQNLETQEAVLRTIHGEIHVKTDVPLPPDRPVVVQVPPGPEPAQITIVLPSIVDALPPAQAVAQPPPAQQGPPPDIPLQEGTVVQATLITTQLPASQITAQPAVQAPEQPVATQIFPQAQIIQPGTTTNTTPALRPVVLPQVTTEIVLPPLQPKTNIPALKTVIDGLNQPQQPALPQSVQENLAQILQAQVLATNTRAIIQPVQTPETPQQQPAPNLAALPLVQELIQNTPLAETLTRALPADIKATLQQVIQTAQRPQSFQLRIVQVTPPEPNAPPLPPAGDNPPPLPLNTEIFGDVIGQNNRGQPIVATEHGNLVLNTRAPVPAGTQVVFQAEAIIQPLAAPVIEGALPLAPLDPLRADIWPALDDALEVITQQAPEAGQALRAALPNTGAPARMTNTMMFFMAALKGGVLESWMGQPQIQALLKAERRDLIERLTGDFRSLSTQSTEPLSGEWRAISLPFMNDEQLTQLQLFVRHQGDEDGEDGEAGDGKRTRFIVNLKLSAIGPMQIDGLLRQKQLDLVLRTDTALTERLRHEIRETYGSAIETAGLNGGITFQAQRQGWIHIDELQDDIGVVA